MSARAQLESYLDALRWRVRTLIYTQTAAAAAAALLIVTCTAVWLLQKEGFPAQIAWIGRAVLLLAIAGIAIVLLWRPLRALRREDGAEEFERLMPEQKGRVRTYLDGVRREAQGARSPLLDLLAEDAATRAERTPPQQLIPQSRLVTAIGIAGVAVAALVALTMLGPAYWGHGARYLLFGATVPTEIIPVRRILVKPGDATVRKNSDFTVNASVEGFDPDEAAIFVRFADDQKWERAPMQSADAQGSWQFKLFALRAPLQYYVEAEGVRSNAHNVTVMELPRIKSVKLTYEYPQWTGLDPFVDENSRDIRAVAGTNVKLEVLADGPLESPALIVDGAPGEMEAKGEASTGVIPVKKEGRYHIGARVANEFVALTDEYYIDIVNDEKPTIEIVKPGRDWRATSIEEVPVRIQAQDDFRLQRVELKYAVNGGEWKTLPIDSKSKQTKSDSLLRLEELGALKAAVAEEQRLEPGDLVSYYAVAKDREQTVQTDLFMVQVQPFERRFSQGQAGGGGGGGAPGEEQGEISDRQKEILLATWNLQRSDQRNSKSREQLEDNAKMLSELQSTLAQQARTLAERTRARVAVDEDPGMKQFVESLEKAATLMDPAAKHLNNFKLSDAVPVEQQALQQVLRAESAFRDVQVAMQRGGGGGGGGAQDARNLAEMFELEMDLDKNQYETESQVSMENSQQELDDAIRKLKQLAERQEKLAQEANRSAMSAEEQRWRQEQLRREAEDLKRRLAELARNERNNQQNAQANAQNSQSQSSQSGSPSESQSGSQQSGQQQSGSSQGSSQSEQRPGRVANALNSLEQALEQMRAANNAQQEREQRNGQASDQRNGEQSPSEQGQQGSEPIREADTRSAREASRNLRRALEQIDRPSENSGNGLAERLQDFARRTQQLVNDQERVESDLNDAIADAQRNGARGGDRGAIDPRRAEQLVEAKQEMANELSDLQSDMRSAAQEHRKRTPQSTQRLGEAISELDASSVMYRLNRSAAEIFYSRAREAAAREGLITEALENLQQNLQETAQLAAREQKNATEGVKPDQLLAELGELRRAVQEAQNRQAAQNGRGATGQDRAGEPGADQSGEPGSESGESQEGQSGEGQSQNGSSPNGNQSGSRSASNGNARGGGYGGGLRAWNPVGPVGPLQGWNGGGSIVRETQEIGDRIQGYANRLDGGELSKTEIENLRRMANQLRRLTGDPMAAQSDAMIRLIDQIEIAALAASAKSKNEASPHTAIPSADSPQYRETVAEYYRRLGGGT